MPREFSRGTKVADLIQRELSTLIQREVRDPRIGMVTVNEARVSRDLAFSDVYFTVLGNGGAGEAGEVQEVDEAKEVENALNQASGFLRSQLARILKTRTTPKLRFHYDNTTRNAAKLDEAIAAAVERDAAGRLANGGESGG